MGKLCVSGRIMCFWQNYVFLAGVCVSGRSMRFWQDYAFLAELCVSGRIMRCWQNYVFSAETCRVPHEIPDTSCCTHLEFLDTSELKRTGGQDDISFALSIACDADREHNDGIDTCTSCTHALLLHSPLSGGSSLLPPQGQMKSVPLQQP
jgi:hypothetical protein